MGAKDAPLPSGGFLAAHVRDPGVVLPTAGAIGYAAAAHAAGVALILRFAAAPSAAPAALAAAALGVLLTAHGRIIAAYLVHELAHSSVFKRPAGNEALGVLCLWMCVPVAARAGAGQHGAPGVPWPLRAAPHGPATRARRPGTCSASARAVRAL